MMETVHVMLEKICVLMSIIFFPNSIKHDFWEILIPKIKPITIGIFYRHPSTNYFLYTFSNDFQQVDSKTNETYFLRDFNNNLF